MLVLVVGLVVFLGIHSVSIVALAFCRMNPACESAGTSFTSVASICSSRTTESAARATWSAFPPARFTTSSATPGRPSSRTSV